MDHLGYWPPFYDPTWPDPDEGRPAYVTRPVTTLVDGQIKTVDMEIPCYYL